jgi:co-chaperonin GroES (HSP10)|tara:strand:+ start:708 stop:1016 length:309 start_codon:yes stop_codon:yes gene_type:complete
MTKILAEGNHIIVEKIDYNKEETTESGLIIKKSQILDSSFCEAKIISMGKGLPNLAGNIPQVDYTKGDTILYDARSRIGLHNDFDVIKREDVIAMVVEDETE